jgi:rhodanese-related sulfurtransferase
MEGVKIKMVKRSFLILFAVVIAISFATASIADMTAKDFVKDAKARIKEISVEQAKAELTAGKAVFLDVRTEKEFKKGHIPKAVFLQRGLLEFKVEGKLPDKNAKVIVYCKTGGRASLAADTLQKMGYKNVVSIAGGWAAWSKAGYPVE